MTHFPRQIREGGGGTTNGPILFFFGPPTTMHVKMAADEDVYVPDLYHAADEDGYGPNLNDASKLQPCELTISETIRGSICN